MTTVSPVDLVYDGVGDRPTPSTDQLFAVRVSNFDDTDSSASRYYVAPNSVVIGSSKKNSYKTDGVKRRAVSNPVYLTTGCWTLTL